MHLAPPRYMDITDATGAVIAIPMPILAQIEACIRLDAPAAGGLEDAHIRHKRVINQIVALTVLVAPPFWQFRAWWCHRKARLARIAWLRTLQYHQLLDLHGKLMLWVQGIDFDTQEKFEAALADQKKSTVTAPPSHEPTPSPVSATSPSVSP